MLFVAINAATAGHRAHPVDAADGATPPLSAFAAVIPIARQFSVRRAKNLLICLVFLEPRPSILAPVRYSDQGVLDEKPQLLVSLQQSVCEDALRECAFEFDKAWRSLAREGRTAACHGAVASRTRQHTGGLRINSDHWGRAGRP